VGLQTPRDGLDMGHLVSKCDIGFVSGKGENSIVVALEYITKIQMLKYFIYLLLLIN
jgi:hypothetical protein